MDTGLLVAAVSICWNRCTGVASPHLTPIRYRRWCPGQVAILNGLALTLVASGVPPGLAARMHCFQTRWGAPFPATTCVGKCKTRGAVLQPLPRCARLRASLPWPRYARLRASLRCAVGVCPYNLASLCSPQSLTMVLGWGARKGLTSRASAAAGLESYRKKICRESVNIFENRSASMQEAQGVNRNT